MTPLFTALVYRGHRDALVKVARWERSRVDKGVSYLMFVVVSRNVSVLIYTSKVTWPLVGMTLTSHFLFLIIVSWMKLNHQDIRNRGFAYRNETSTLNNTVRETRDGKMYSFCHMDFKLIVFSPTRSTCASSQMRGCAVCACGNFTLRCYINEYTRAILSAILNEYSNEIWTRGQTNG